MAIPPQEADQANFCFLAIAVGKQVDLRTPDRSPQAFHQDVVVSTLSS